MKTLKIISLILITVLLASCASTSNFPVSSLVPAADITAKFQKIGKGNYMVTITANNLAASERLNPAKQAYVIWAVSDFGNIRNVGNFVQKNAVKATYKASFPYKPKEIFITAEDDEGICLPNGIEITRIYK